MKHIERTVAKIDNLKYEHCWRNFRLNFDYLTYWILTFNQVDSLYLCKFYHSKILIFSFHRVNMEIWNTTDTFAECCSCSFTSLINTRYYRERILRIYKHLKEFLKVSKNYEGLGRREGRIVLSSSDDKANYLDQPLYNHSKQPKGLMISRETWLSHSLLKFDRIEL